MPAAATWRLPQQSRDKMTVEIADLLSIKVLKGSDRPNQETGIDDHGSHSVSDLDDFGRGCRHFGCAGLVFLATRLAEFCPLYLPFKISTNIKSPAFRRLADSKQVRAAGSIHSGRRRFRFDKPANPDSPFIQTKKRDPMAAFDAVGSLVGFKISCPLQTVESRYGLSHSLRCGTDASSYFFFFNSAFRFASRLTRNLSRRISMIA